MDFGIVWEHKYEESDKYLEPASRSIQIPLIRFSIWASTPFPKKNGAAEAMLRKAIKLTGSDEARTNYQIRRAYVDMARILGQSGRMEESKIYAAKAHELQNKTMGQTQQKVM